MTSDFRTARHASSAAPADARWLIDLRWGAIAAQAAALIVVHAMLGIRLPLAALGLIVLAYAGVNALALILAARPRPVPAAVTGALGLFDLVELTALLYFTGGPYNPFTFLYLVTLALGALVLPTAWAWALCAAAVGCYGLLFIEHRDLDVSLAPHHDSSLHVKGMWASFSVAALFIVGFVNRVSLELRRKEEELAAERERAARTRQLALLASLAAGAAHELSTPLSTIAVVAKELERRALAGAHGAEGATAEDARLIREEVERCRETLYRISAQAGQTLGEPVETVPIARLIDSILADSGAAARVSVNFATAARDATLRTWSRALRQALGNVIRNALDASPEGAPVLIRGDSSGGWLRLAIEDRGAGMTPDVLSHAGEPFFTTKPEGEGMGLGLFLTRSVIEQAGGTLRLEPNAGAGITARIDLPLAPVSNKALGGETVSTAIAAPGAHPFAG